MVKDFAIAFRVNWLDYLRITAETKSFTATHNLVSCLLNANQSSRNGIAVEDMRCTSEFRPFKSGSHKRKFRQM